MAEHSEWSNVYYSSHDIKPTNLGVFNGLTKKSALYIWTAIITTNIQLIF